MKASGLKRFEAWFPKKEASNYALRRQDQYKQDFALRDCLKNAPIYRMRNILNELNDNDHE